LSGVSPEGESGATCQTSTSWRERTTAAVAAPTAATAASGSANFTRRLDGHMIVGLGGLEPPTSSLSAKRSNHLSYRPVLRIRPSDEITALVAPLPKTLVPVRQRHFDTADQIRCQVVDECGDGGHRGHQHNVDQPDQDGPAEDGSAGDEFAAAPALVVQ
jgi:hypothetical protein